MKRTLKSLIALLLFCAVLSGAVALSGCAEKRQGNEKIKIICTVFPLYDWVRNIVGQTEAVEVSLLISSGTDVHSYQPSFADMAKIKDSDAVIYVGGESDSWVEQSVEDSAVSVAISEIEAVTLYEVSSDSFASAHSHEVGEECHEAHDGAFDEHVWLSVRNAMAACDYICEVLCELDGENAEQYRDNTALYSEKLSALDARLCSIAKNISEPLVFADRFPFVYVLEDYAIDYYAAFEGCTAEANADFDTTIRLAERMDDFDGKYLFVTESPIDKGLADSVIAQTEGRSASVVTLDSMQSLTQDDINEGACYISIMEKNADVLEQIFGSAEG